MKKKLLSLVLACVLLLSLSVSASATHWADPYYAHLSTQKILNDDFGSTPHDLIDSPITREYFFSLVVCAIYGKQSPVQNTHFADFSLVSPKLQGYIHKAYTEKLVTGVEDQGKYLLKPQENITRQEAATVLGRALSLKISEPSPFTDDSTIGIWALDYVSACAKSAIFNGFPDGSFGPVKDITWAESVKIISQAVKSTILNPLDIKPVAGSGLVGNENGTAMSASFKSPTGLFVSNGTIYVADTYNNLIRRISNGNVSTYSGKIMGYDNMDNVLNGFYNNSPLVSLFARPTDILSSSSNILVLDSENHAIRQIGTSVTTFAGTGKAGNVDGAKSIAQFNSPRGFCLDDKGNIYIADTGNNSVRMINSSGNVSTVAKDILAPSALAYHQGSLYVTSLGEHRIFKITDGKVEAFAGATPTFADDFGYKLGEYMDGPLSKAYFNAPTDICISQDGTIYVADNGNAMIRKIKDGEVSTIVGIGKNQPFISPTSLVLDGNSLYVSDSFKNTIFKIELPK